MKKTLFVMLIALATALLPAACTPAPTSTLPPPPASTPVLAGTPAPMPAAVISPQNADQVIQLARWGKGTVRKVAYAPDGELLAVASTLGLSLYNAQTLEEVRSLETDARMWSVAFSPDGTTLASGSGWKGDLTVRLWRVSDGTLLHTLEGHTWQQVENVAFSPDGQTLASVSWDGTVRLWRVSDGALLRELGGGVVHRGLQPRRRDPGLGSRV